MEPKTIDQILEDLVLAAKSLTLEQRSKMTFDSLMTKLRTPVGGLKTRRGN